MAAQEDKAYLEKELEKELDKIIQMQYDMQQIDPKLDVYGKQLGLNDLVAEETILRLAIKKLNEMSSR